MFFIDQATSVMASAINFFLGIETKMMDDDDEEIKITNISEINRHEHSRKTKKRLRSVKKQEERNAKAKRSLEDKKLAAVPLFPAIQMLNDPQSLAEKLFKRIRQSGESFQIKLLVMNFISRLIGCHKLIILNFYRY